MGAPEGPFPQAAVSSCRVDLSRPAPHPTPTSQGTPCSDAFGVPKTAQCSSSVSGGWAAGDPDSADGRPHTAAGSERPDLVILQHEGAGTHEPCRPGRAPPGDRRVCLSSALMQDSHTDRDPQPGEGTQAAAVRPCWGTAAARALLDPHLPAKGGVQAHWKVGEGCPAERLKS